MAGEANADVAGFLRGGGGRVVARILEQIEGRELLILVVRGGG